MDLIATESKHLQLAQVLPHLLGLWIAYRIIRVLYNISPLHPLSYIPGPRLAAMSTLYEFWFDFIKFGRYSMEIKRMHEIWGPIVRISPNEVHCNDPDMLDEIYASGGRRREKSAHWVSSLPSPVSASVLTTVDHDLHRRRRQAMANSFSRGSIATLQPLIHDKVQRLCDKLLRYPSQEPFNVMSAYSCFTTDVITDYCFGEPFGLLEQDGWEPNFLAPSIIMQDAQPVFKFFPVAHWFAGVFPKIAKLMGPDMALFIEEIIENMPDRVIKAKQAAASSIVRERKAVFEDILNSPALPESEKSVFRLTGDGVVLITAGTETTAWTLTVLTYHLLTTPSIRTRLEQELKGFDPKKLSWQALERLPYLTAVILEALRLSYGVAARLPRVAPDEDIVHHGKTRDYVIPKGFAIGMSTVITHHNEDIFPDSHRFLPERWLNEKSQRRPDLEKYLLSFSRGSRGCVGKQLAWCNLYLATAALVLRVFPHMKLYETTIDDIRYDHDAFVPRPKVGTKGVRVLVL